MKQPVKSIRKSSNNLFAAMHKFLTLNRKGGYIMKKPVLQSSSLFLLLLGLGLTVIFMAAGCEKPKNDNNSQLQSASLQGTQWKLEGIVNVQTGEMQVLEPVDCEQCYTLVFDTDTTASGKASPNGLTLLLAADRPIIEFTTYINHLGDEALFCEAAWLITRYEHDATNAKLKFFYQREEKEYSLIFKQITGMQSIPTDFLLENYNCSWNLVNLVHDSVYVINTPETFSTLVSCQGNNAPAIDFNQYSLLIVHGGATYGITALTKELQQISVNVYRLDIDIKLNATAEASHWIVAMLMPKLSPEALITLNKVEHY
jgi:hypothetical protein